LSSVPHEVRAQIAPSGVLRVGLNWANALLIDRTSPISDPRGIVPDLARELAQRLDLRFEFTRYDHPARLVEAARDAACDIGFIASDPQRESDVDFTAPYLDIDVGCVVSSRSGISEVSQVDRSGVRVAVMARSAYDLALSRELKHAILVRAETIEGSYEGFVEQGLEALAGLKTGLVSDVEKFSGARLLDGRLSAVHQAIGLPKGRAGAAAWLRAYVEDIKASGLVARTIAAHGIKGVSVS
jgi:polar amino acid transport system substrate-binding protein